MKTDDYPVDIVIPWVDSSDPDWRRERDSFLNRTETDVAMDASEARFRDGGTLKYVLRGIDRYMPWVRTVHFVTWGHLPEWLDKDAEGLHIVNHRDYIPHAYLPTFSSHTIELNMHRIPGLAEHFIYFNDDMLPLRPLQRQDFFINGLPADFAVETSLTGRYVHSLAGVMLSNASVINQNFSKRKVMREHFGKWFHYRYGINQFKTLLLLVWPRFADFSNNHTANPYLKTTFSQVWEKENELLDTVCRHRFRQMDDVNQWLMRDWQLISGKFVPKSTNTAKVFVIADDLSEIQRALDEKKYQIICINDVSYEKIADFKETTEKIRIMLETVLPGESRFERTDV